MRKVNKIKGRSVYKASLIFGLAIFLSSCTQHGYTPVWHNSYKPTNDLPPQQSISTKESLDKVYIMVEEQPNYPGGIGAWQKHLKTNLNYPSEALKRRVKGKVYLSFDVTDKGKLVNIIVSKGLGFGCDKEAVRLLIVSGTWNPAKQNGTNVNARSQIGISFNL